MRYFLFYISLLLPALANSQAQKPTIVSSASEWVTLKITATDTIATTTTAKAKPSKPIKAKSTTAESKTSVTSVGTSSSAKKSTQGSAATSVTRTFLETFADNRNGWLTGRRNGFELEIARDSYFIRRLRNDKNTPGRSYIKLPSQLNLNSTDTFTVSVEMVAPPNVELDGGLLIGVKDTSNYCQFRVMSPSKVALYSRVNGVSQPNYMTGKPTAAKVPISPARNTLTIRRTGEQLHFYINGQEVEDSPHPFRPFKGNGVGFINFADAVKFQYLTVQLGK